MAKYNVGIIGYGWAATAHMDTKHLYLANVISICRHVGVPKANIAVNTEK